jgi:AraC-like DNA-binding protein
MSTAVAVYHGPFGRASLYRLNRALATHAHREGHLTFHVRGAPSQVTIGSNRVALNPDGAGAINPWQAHSFEPGDDERGTVVLVLYIKPIWFLEAGRCAQNALRFGRSTIEVTPPIARLVSLVSSMLMEDEQSPLFEGYLYQLTRECFDQSWQWCADQDAANPVWGGTRDYRVRHSIRLMQQRISQELVLDEVARDAGLSRPHFYKLFRQQVGLTPNIYLNTLRMETAIERLTKSAEAVTNIGLDLGFASQASFTRFFTSNVGIPPSDYRRAAHLDA